MSFEYFSPTATTLPLNVWSTTVKIYCIFCENKNGAIKTVPVYAMDVES